MIALVSSHIILFCVVMWFDVCSDVCVMSSCVAGEVKGASSVFSSQSGLVSQSPEQLCICLRWRNNALSFSNLHQYKIIQNCIEFIQVIKCMRHINSK